MILDLVTSVVESHTIRKSRRLYTLYRHNLSNGKVVSNSIFQSVLYKEFHPSMSLRTVYDDSRSTIGNPGMKYDFFFLYKLLEFYSIYIIIFRSLFQYAANSSKVFNVQDICYTAAYP